MFTGIIEYTTKVHKLFYDKKNIHITFYNPFFNKIKISQSICHNGICLTVDKLFKKTYTVIASQATLSCTNLKFIKINDEINLERSLSLKSRIDGHLVQGHVDTTAEVIDIIKNNGSWLFFFYSKEISKNIIKKGSICINGISLTIMDYQKNKFHVSIIPYTYKNTNLKFLKKGSIVNIEFDIIGKYINNFIHYQNDLK